MKKYRICLFFIFVVGVFVSSALGYAVGRQRGMALERTRLEAEQNSNHNSERNSEENAGQKLPKNSQDGQGNGQADRPVDTQSLPETLPEDHEATNQRGWICRNGDRRFCGGESDKCGTEKTECRKQ